MSKAAPRFRRDNPSLPARIPNLFEVVLFGDIEGQQTINTFYYADGGAALDSTTEQDIATAWQTAFLADYVACMSSDWKCTGIKVQCLTSESRLPYVAVFASPTAGSGPAGHEPTTVAVCISRYSAYRGQCGRGRIYLPAVPTAWVTASKLTTTTAHAAFTLDMKTGFAEGGITYVAQVVSDGSRTHLGPGAAPVVQATLRTILATVRRRRLGRGK